MSSKKRGLRKMLLFTLYLVGSTIMLLPFFWMISTSLKVDIDVLFSAGFIRHANGFGTLYVGVSDAQIQAMDMEDPFICAEATIQP